MLSAPFSFLFNPILSPENFGLILKKRQPTKRSTVKEKLFTILHCWKIILLRNLVWIQDLFTKRQSWEPLQHYLILITHNSVLLFFEEKLIYRIKFFKNNSSARPRSINPPSNEKLQVCVAVVGSSSIKSVSPHHQSSQLWNLYLSLLTGNGLVLLLWEKEVIKVIMPMCYQQSINCIWSFVTR